MEPLSKRLRRLAKKHEKEIGGEWFKEIIQAMRDAADEIDAYRKDQDNYMPPSSMELARSRHK